MYQVYNNFIIYNKGKRIFSVLFLSQNWQTYCKHNNKWSYSLLSYEITLSSLKQCYKISSDVRNRIHCKCKLNLPKHFVSAVRNALDFPTEEDRPHHSLYKNKMYQDISSPLTGLECRRLDLSLFKS
jgi:hypothetical protein